MSTILECQALSKRFGGKQALDSVDLSLESGRIIGLLGPNGSGKSTLIKLANGLLTPSSGAVLIDGQAPGRETKAVVSYLPERSVLPDWMTTKQAVDFYADFYKDFDKAKALDMMKRFGLPEKQKSKTMSKGMQEKLLMSLVMSRSADLYILDEPMGGVDPATRASILDFIMQNYAEKSTLLISTHLINDLQSVFTHALFLGNGKVLINDSVSNITAGGKSIEDVFKEVFAHVW